MALDMVETTLSAAGLGQGPAADADSGGAGRKRLARSARLQLVLPESSIDRLEAIKDATEAASYAEVFRRSLQLSEMLLLEQRNGSTLRIVRPGGETVDLPLNLLMK